ncbi:hspbap1, partial [Symbiodinium microadriaticum]
MNLLALPLERDQIFSIKRRFPGFSGKVPEEAAFWSEADLEAYFGSNGRALRCTTHKVLIRVFLKVRKHEGRVT